MATLPLTGALCLIIIDWLLNGSFRLVAMSAVAYNVGVILAAVVNLDGERKSNIGNNPEDTELDLDDSCIAVRKSEYDEKKSIVDVADVCDSSKELAVKLPADCSATFCDTVDDIDMKADSRSICSADAAAV